MKIVLIVPTKDRPKDIQNLFESIVIQNRLPDTVIVVDGSDNPIKNVIEKYESKISIKYLTCRPPSLPKQRNVGIENIPSGTNWVGFLDDDLILEPDTLENLENFIMKENDLKLKGVGLSIINQPLVRGSFFNQLFLIGGDRHGHLLSSGFPSAIPCPDRDLNTDWLYGGATFWSKEVFEQFKFDEWFSGTGYMEDIDFSYRVSRKYNLMVSSKARCYHYHHGISLAKETSIGEWQLTSWWYFIRKHKDFNWIFVFWGMSGIILKNILALILQRNKANFKRMIGHFKGIYKILKGDALKLKGFSK